MTSESQGRIIGVVEEMEIGEPILSFAPARQDVDGVVWNYLIEK